jgi:trimethylamine corrinoid protein
MLDKLIKSIVEIKEQESIQITMDLIKNGEDPMRILGASSDAMKRVGELFESEEYFLPELMLAGEILNQITVEVKPLLQSKTVSKTQGKVLIGTVKGDVHDLGKNIVTFLLEANGFEVKDLGVDVSPETFIEEIKRFQPGVLGLSGLLTLAYGSMKKTVDTIKEAGLKDQVKIIIGGGQMSDKVCDFIGADAYGKDAQAGITYVKKHFEIE